MNAELTRPITSLDLIAHALTRNPDRLVVIGVDGREVTAGGLAGAISRQQQYFEALDPKPRRVAVLARNRLEVLEVANGLGFAGIVQTALHPMGAIEDYLYVLEDASIDTLVYDPDQYEAIAVALREKAPGLRHILAMGPGGIGADIAAASASFVARPLAAPPSDPEALFRIAYSGGTTGKPKGIMTSLRNATTSAIIQLTDWEWPDEVRHLICAPLSHSGAAVLTTVLAKDGFMVVLPGFEPVAVMEAIASASHHLGADGADDGDRAARSSAFRRIRSLQS